MNTAEAATLWINTLEAAKFWLDQGVAPIPLVFQSKKPVVEWTKFKSVLPSERLVEEWFSWRWNIALVTGWQNLCILDFDNPESYAIFFVWSFEHRPGILNTYREQSSRGIHLFYYLREPVKLVSFKNALFEVKTAGKLVTTAPSVHESGRVYTALDDPTNIRVVRPEEILNYSPVVFHHPQKPKEIYASQFAPAAHTGQVSCIGEIKARIKILSFFPHAKQVDHEGRYWRTNCPFHGRKDNFWIDNVMGVCGCFAGCGHFDVIDLWAKLNNLSNGEAIQDLEKLL